jgi:hypothetical protein
LGFDGAPLSAPPAETAPAAGRASEPALAAQGDLPAAPAAALRKPDPLAVDEQGLYRWEDDQGELHFGAGAQVPPRFRKRARPVSASVGVMPLDRPPPAPAQPLSLRPSGAAQAQAQPPAQAPAQEPAAPPSDAQPAAAGPTLPPAETGTPR